MANREDEKDLAVPAERLELVLKLSRLSIPALPCSVVEWLTPGPEQAGPQKQ